MNEPKQITLFQTVAIIINSTIGITVLALPRIASEKVGAGAFLVTIIAFVILIISTWILAKLSQRFPRETIVIYGQQVISKPLGKIFGFLIICFFIIITSFILREFGEVMNTTLLRETPIKVTILSILLLVAISTRNDILTISYMNTYYLPFIVVPVILMVLIAIQDIEIRHLKPFIGNDTHFVDFFWGGIAVAGLPFFQIGLYIITVTTPYMIAPKKIVKASLVGMLFSGMMILLSVGITVAVFGSEEIDTSLWPMLVLTRMSELPAAILERLDVIFLVVWIISAFTTILSGFLISIKLFSQLFCLRSHRVLSYLSVPLFFVITLYPDNVIHLYELMNLIGQWGLLLTIGYPLLLLLLSMIRGIGGTLDG
jgi:spore germination protein